MQITVVGGWDLYLESCILHLGGQLGAARYT